jgi:hypothetical protein
MSGIRLLYQLLTADINEIASKRASIISYPFNHSFTVVKVISPRSSPKSLNIEKKLSLFHGFSDVSANADDCPITVSCIISCIVYTAAC